MAPIPVLFTHFGDEWFRGSETALLDLLSALDRERIRPVVWCNASEMAAAASSAGYPTHRSDFRHFFDYSSPRPNPSYLLGLVRTCRALCRTYGIRVLHANSGAPAQWLIPTGFGARLPVLVHLHSNYFRRSRYVLLLHRATLAVGVSRQVVNDLLADGMAPARTRVIYNGINVARLKRSATDLKALLNIPPGAFVIATTGSLITGKGHDVLIRAFARLSAEPMPHLLILGDGPERNALEALVGSLGIAARVHFLGYIRDFVEVYQAADLFALASRGDAFGLVLAEAGHFGLPSVSTRVGGIPEVIAHEETGLLVPPDDVTAFSSALERLMGDKALRARFGSAAAARVEAMFTVDRMARQFEEAYADLAAIPAAQLGWRGATRELLPYLRLIGARYGKPQMRP
jgi:L-malate glycosyltransferase